MFEWMRDSDVTKYLQTDFASMSREQVQEFIDQAAVQTGESSSLHFAIVDNSDDYMGTISLKNIDHRSKNAEYAIAMRREAHGKGLAFSATMEVLKLAFEEMLLERIYLCVTVNNLAANKLYVKCGFTEEGVFRKHLMIDGNLLDLRWYGLLREDYLKMHNL